MNRIQPIDLRPAIEEIEEEKKEDRNGDQIMDQKTRHFKYFEMLDTLPCTADANTNQEHMLEVNAAGAF